jgi:predicted RNA-binding Zn-ribbon protein involved in translation (DUF1610 family)
MAQQYLVCIQGRGQQYNFFLQNRLPCNRRQNMYYGYVSYACALCGELEHQKHIYRCESCTVRANIRVKYLKDLRYYLENSRLKPTTARVIVQCVQAHLEGYDSPDIEDMAPDASSLLIQAIEEQEEIGWDQWFKGRLSKKWGEIYDIDLCTINHNLRHQTSQRWATNLIKDIFKFVLEFWSVGRSEIKLIMAQMMTRWLPQKPN